MIRNNFGANVVFLLLASFLTANQASDLPLPSDRREIEAVVVRLWNSHNFQQLDALEVALRTHPRTSPSGGSLLYLFYQALDEAQNPADFNESDMRELNRNAAIWVARYPDSQLARFIEVYALMSKAWIARGPEFADRTSERQWADYARLSKIATDYLIKNKHFLEGNLNWYRAMLDIAQRTSWPERSYVALLDEALRKYPGVPEFFIDPINHYSPKWGGSPAAIAAYIQKSTSQVPPALANEIYARQYSYVLENGFPLSVGAPSFDCARWTSGYDAFVSKFPTAYNFNHAAVAASFCNDRRHAKSYFAKIGSEPPDGTPWKNVFGTVEAFNAKRSWAFIE